jgi:hypothetical protein
MSDRLNFEPEEDWEASIASMLAKLPPVEPPDGFMNGAMNHRPLYAGRASLGLGAAALVGMALAIGLGGLRSSGVVPQVDSMAQQHSLATASFFAPFQSDSEPVSEDPEQILAQLPEVSLPSGLEPKASFVGADFRQALFAGPTSGDTVSIFHQPGLVDFDKMPVLGLREIEGIPAWVDPEKSITVIQAKDEAVTIVGLSADEVASVVRSVPESGPMDKMAEALNTITSHLGFPNVS